MTSPLQRQRSELRRQARARRNALPDDHRTRAHRQFARILARHMIMQPGRRIGVYQAWGTEADLAQVITLGRRRGCRLYLPVITDYRRHRMCFAPFPQGAAMRVNRYGIAEVDPRRHPCINRQQLDVILVPLVAVDHRGSRLGSGAGFYDRYLQHRLNAGQWRRPRLIGVAYECQRLRHIPADRWDVPMDAVLTENALYPCAAPDASLTADKAPDREQ